MSELLLASPLDRTPTRCVETLYQSARSLVAVLGEVLDFARLEGGVLNSSRLPFDLHDLIKSVGTVLQTQAGENGLTGGVDIGANCPQFVVGDATRLRQILLTLIDTAVKFTGHGAVRLHASASAAGGQMLVRFDITDTGVGLSKSVQERLFQPYVQIDNNVVAGVPEPA